MKSKLNKGLSLVKFLVLVCFYLLISFSNILFAQEIQMIPIMPQIPLPVTQSSQVQVIQPGIQQVSPSQSLTPVQQSTQQTSQSATLQSSQPSMQQQISPQPSGTTFQSVPSPQPALQQPVTQPPEPSVQEKVSPQIPSQPTQTEVSPFPKKQAPVTTTETAAGETLEEISPFEAYVSGKLPLTISTKVRQFGYDLFLKPPSTFAPADKVPVGPDYVIGPGDEIRVSVWGMVEGQWSAVVDRDGNITLPRIGTVGVAGLTFKELKEVLYKEFSKYYKNFEMNVSMGSLRTITVYVVGYAKHPGAYTVSSLATLVNALFAAGGPSKNGSMRNIVLKRNGETVVVFDMYDFLLKGDKTKDVRLMPEDVIYIPPVGPLVAIVGNVKNPAIYELKGDVTVSDLIAMAGGLTSAAYLNRLQVERIYENEVKILLDINFKEFNKDKDILLKDGDIVKIYPIANVIINAVTLKGNVVRPGEYQWFPGMKVSDLIKDVKKDLLPETYFDFALIERLVPPDYHTEYVPFNLGKALFEKDPNEDKLLQPYDIITIYSKWDFLERPKVRIAGAVNKPGEYEFKPNMTVSDLVNLAGGLKYYAFTEKAELTRVKPTPQGPKTERIIISLEKALKGDPEHNLPLQQDDYLFVRTVPEWQLYMTVTIAGEVKFPGTYTIKKGERLSSLIERAGGYTDKAYLRGAVFIRKSVKELQQKSLEAMIARLEQELFAEETTQVLTALSSEEIQARKAALENKRKFIEALKQLKATGRMVVRLAHPRLLKGSEYDIELEDGDFLYIPTKNNVVNVVGAVMSPGTLVYSEKLTYKDYIQMCGGLTKYADTENIYVIKVDGSARKLSRSLVSWNPFKSRWELSIFGEEEKEIEPGDTIVVPEKLERIAWLREIRDITQILMQMAVTAGVVVNLF